MLVRTLAWGAVVAGTGMAVDVEMLTAWMFLCDGVELLIIYRSFIHHQDGVSSNPLTHVHCLPTSETRACSPLLLGLSRTSGLTYMRVLIKDASQLSRSWAGASRPVNCYQPLQSSFLYLPEHNTYGQRRLVCHDAFSNQRPAHDPDH